MEWQPIETAPKDGTWVVVKSHRNGVDHQPAVAAFFDGLWMEVHHFLSGGVDYDSWPLSHWMPIPQISDTPESVPIVKPYNDGKGVG